MGEPLAGSNASCVRKFIFPDEKATEGREPVLYLSSKDNFRIKHCHQCINVYKVEETYPQDVYPSQTVIDNKCAVINGHAKFRVWHDETVTSIKEAHREGLSTGLKNPSGKGKLLIILHIGSDPGFLEGEELIFEVKKSEGDYYSEMDAHNFEKCLLKFS